MLIYVRKPMRLLCSLGPTTCMLLTNTTSTKVLEKQLTIHPANNLEILCNENVIGFYQDCLFCFNFWKKIRLSLKRGHHFFSVPFHPP